MLRGALRVQEEEDRLILITMTISGTAEKGDSRRYSRGDRGRGNAVYERKSSRGCVSYKQIGHVTYWVYYAPEGEAWRVKRAYSHRMEIR